MGLLKMAILIIGDLFFPPSGIPLFSILYFGWSYIKIKIKADIYLTYLLFLGIPQIILFFIIRLIALPFKESYGVLKWIEDKLENLTKGVEYVEHNVKKSVFGAMLFLALSFTIFQPSLGSLTSAASFISVSSLQGALFAVFVLLVGAFLPVILIATIISLFKGGIGGKDSGSELDSMYTSPGASEAASEYREAIESREQMHQAKSVVEKGAEKAAESEGSGILEWFKGCVPGNVSSVGGKLAELNPMASEAAEKRAKKAGKAGVASEGAEMGYEAVEAGEGVALWPLMIFAIILLVFQIGLIFAVFGFVVKLYMPLIGGPMLSALGFSAEYANYGGQAIEPYIPNVDLSPIAVMVQSQVAKLQCFAQGPECFTEWQMNNTQRPGSEEKGQEYDLDVEDFQIEQGQTIDVAYQPPSRPLSVSFALENPRYGLKGIPAEDVQYKIDVSNKRDKKLCGTDFLPINFYQDSLSIDKTTIPAGDSFAYGVGSQQEELVQEELNLFNCRLLQPGQAKITRTAELSYMYDYNSQSNLRVQAMSYENYADRDLDRGYKKSETADTPVKSYVNVYAPVLYDKTDEGDPRPRPFQVQIGLQTDDPNIRYRVDPDSVKFTPSRSTEIVDGQCGDFGEGKSSSEGVQSYELSDSAKEQILRETERSDRWYNQARSMSVMECTMKLEEPGQISSSGETLIMDVSANYTVIKDGNTKDFQLWNTLCSGRDCPLLVKQNQHLENSPESIQDNFLTTCDPNKRATAVGGCDVRSLGLSDGDTITEMDDMNEDAWINGVYGGEKINYELINEGDTAYDWNYLIEEDIPESAYRKAYFSKTGGKPVVGLTEDEWDWVDLGEEPLDEDLPPSAIYVTENAGEKDVESREITRRDVCADLHDGDKKAAVEEFAHAWQKNRYAEKVLFIKPWRVRSSCEPDQGFWEEAFDNLVDGEDKQDAYDDATSGCSGVLTLLKSGSYSCFESNQ